MEYRYMEDNKNTETEYNFWRVEVEKLQDKVGLAQIANFPNDNEGYNMARTYNVQNQIYHYRCSDKLETSKEEASKTSQKRWLYVIEDDLKRILVHEWKNN